MALEGQKEDDDVVSFLDILVVLARRKILIIGATVLAAILAVAYSVLSILLPPDKSPLPNFYTAKALVMLKSPTGSSSGALNELTGLASLIGAGSIVSSSANPTDIVLALVKQESFLDQLADDLSLLEHYRISNAKAPRTAVRAKINKSLKTTVDDASIVMVSFSDDDPAFAARAANRSVEILKARYAEVTMKLARDRFSAIEDSIASARVVLEETQRRFTAFQSKYGFYDIDYNTQDSLALVTKANQDLLELQNRLRILRGYRSEDDPTVKALKDQIDQAKLRVQDLRRGTPELEGLAIAPDKLLQVASEYALLKGDLTIQQGIYAFLKQQLETTRIEEISGSRIFTVIQEAAVPEVKAGPSRVLITIVVTMATFIISILAAFVLEYGVRVSRDPLESKKLAELRSNLRLRSRGR